MKAEYWTALAAMFLSATLVRWSVWYASRAGHVDIPNDRSSHIAPTPRGGGVGLVVAMLTLGIVSTLRADPTYSTELILLATAVVGLSTIGFLDDRFVVSPLIRLTVHIAAAITIAILMARLAPIAGWINIFWLLLWAFWTVSSINIVNFMDGIDGMVGAQGVIYGLYLSILVPAGSLAQSFALIIAFGSLGFLLWNWAPARIFMGDVGSGALGLLLVAAAAVAVGTGVHPALVFLPLFPLFFDALATVMLRYRRGERLSVAHRSHLYQRIAQAPVGHAIISASYAAAAAVGGLMGAALSSADGVWMFAGIATYVGAVMVTWMLFHRRFPLMQNRRTTRAEA